MKVLELFCGIVGCAAALGRRADVVAAVDQSRVALDVYAHNFPHPVLLLAIENIPGTTWCEWAEAAWWMSPPCSPYTRRGLRRDLDDPRARSLVAVNGQISIMLDVMVYQNNQVRQILTTMFTRNPIQRVLRFLHDQTHILEDITVLASLPPLPFLRALRNRL